MTPLELITACAPLVAPVTVAAVVQHESGGDPLAVHDNATGRSFRPRTEGEAIALAENLIAQGHSVDLGLGQINSRNLSWLGQTVKTILRPCVNLAATQNVLLAAWKQAGGSLAGALSIYNTGKIDSATGSSYASAVYAQARGGQAAAPVIPAIPDGRLPGWVARELPAAESAALSPEDLRAAARPVRAPARSARAVTPAGSALRPDAGDLRMGNGSPNE